MALEDREAVAHRSEAAVPDGIAVKCEECSSILLKDEWEAALKVCPKCGHHSRLSAQERIRLLCDEGSFQEWDREVVSSDPLGFPEYRAKLERDAQRTGLAEAAVTGRAAIGAVPCAIAITDSRFLMGSMGSAVGEKVTRAIERATQDQVSVLTICGSGGGARMHEGILSLMQMAKTTAALARHSQRHLLHLSLLTDPSMAGVLASFASVGDIVIAEPGAMIGFAGGRVSAQAQVVDVPKDFQTSEFQLRSGMIDMVVHRRDLRDTIIRILNYLAG
jgi:acetyl-CoA carboxylase carboxyl transferase subunit beta